MSRMSRRQFMVVGGGAVFLAACRSSSTTGSGAPAAGASTVGPSSPAVSDREARRGIAAASTVTAALTAAPVDTVVGGRQVSTWAFGDRPGAGGLRAKAGDVLDVTFTNRLPSANTVHWHGIALRNDMDGVHDLTQKAVSTGESFRYRFTLPDPGTYWFHPHMGLELDRGLYAPLVVEDPNEPVAYDVDATLMLDDWLDGYGRTAEQVLEGLKAGGGHSGHMMSGDSSGGMGGSGGMAGMMGGSATSGGMASAGMTGVTGDVAYPLHVINGRGPGERDTVAAKPGQRVRLRLINAGSDTAYRVAVAGHRMTVTHADGFPVAPVDVDCVRLGMGERYDVIVTALSGAFPIVAVPEGKNDPAGEAVLRTSESAAPPVTGSRPAELTRQLLAYGQLAASSAVALPAHEPDRTETLVLSASMSGYTHGIDGKSFPDSAPVTVRQGERLRLRIMNDTMMFHPIHLHGHTFQLVSAGSARKDTVNVMPMSTTVVDVQADNPGQWMLHCHNTYHLETGMATVLSYRA